MKQFIPFILIYLFLINCQNKLQTGNYKILETIQNEENVEQYRRANFDREYPLSMMFGHHNIRILNDDLIRIALASSEDEILVYNITKDTLSKILINTNEILQYKISQIYFHNYDSIFIFFNRDHLMRNRYTQLINITFDFILINSDGELINTYSLDSVPYTKEKGRYNVIVMKSKYLTQNQIYDNILLIPFTIYLPKNSQPRFNEFWPKMLCKYNLSTKEITMLNVRFPEEDIGKHFAKKVTESTIDFEFKNDSTIYYVHQYSPTIYEYDFIKDKLIRKFEFSDQEFYCNHKFIDSMVIDNETTQSLFNAPFYVQDENIYLRQIEIRKYKDYKSKILTQIFDTNMKLLGYSLSDSNYSSLYSSHGKLCKTKLFTQEVFNQTLGHPKILSINEIESKYFNKIYSTKTKEPLIMGLNNRIIIYLDKYKLVPNSKTILINTNSICSSCIKELMEKLVNNLDMFEENNITYFFYGDDQKIADRIIENYKIPKTKAVFLEYSTAYKQYINNDETQLYYFIKHDGKSGFKIDQVSFKDIKSKLDEFVN